MRTKNDLERTLAKLPQFVTMFDGAVMFDDTKKQGVMEYVKFLRGMQDSANVLENLAEVM